MIKLIGDHNWPSYKHTEEFSAVTTGNLHNETKINSTVDCMLSALTEIQPRTETTMNNQHCTTNPSPEQLKSNMVHSFWKKKRLDSFFFELNIHLVCNPEFSCLRNLYKRKTNLNKQAKTYVHTNLHANVHCSFILNHETLGKIHNKCSNTNICQKYYAKWHPSTWKTSHYMIPEYNQYEIVGKVN